VGFAELFDFNFTFLWTLINLLVLFLFLKIVLFKRVGDFMDKRNAAIEAAIKGGEEAKTKGELFEKEQRYLYNTAAAKKAATLQEARKQANHDAEAILAQARTEAARIVDEASAAAIRESERVMASLRSEAVGLALAAAGKVLEERLNSDADRDVVTAFLAKQGGE
jgi:F-type H+-transporting ATPase subunit b